MAKFAIQTKKLKEALSFVSKGISSRPNHPILQFLQLTFENEILTIRSTDLSLFVETKIQIDSLYPEKLTLLISAKELIPIVQKGKESIEISYLEEMPERVEIIGTNFKFKLGVGNNADYPEFPTLENEPVILSANDFKRLTQSVLYATATDETKQVLTGVCLRRIEQGIQSSATDGHRMALCTAEGEQPELNVVLASNLLKAVSNFIPEQGEVYIRQDESQVSIEYGDSRIVGRLFQASFPDISNFIPKESQSHCVVSKESLLNALDTVSIMAKENAQTVILSFDKDNNCVSLFSEVQDKGDCTVTIPIDSPTGDLLNIGFNCSYLMDAVKNLQSVEVVLWINKSNTPIMLSALGGQHYSLTGSLLMPVQIRG